VIAFSRIQIDIDLRDVSDRNLATIRQELKKRLGTVGNATETTESQESITTVVQSLGGPPWIKFDAQFWSRANRMLPKAQRVEDVIALARRYYRAMRPAGR